MVVRWSLKRAVECAEKIEARCGGREGWCNKMGVDVWLWSE